MCDCGVQVCLYIELSTELNGWFSILGWCLRSDFLFVNYSRALDMSVFCHRKQVVFECLYK